MKLLSIIVPVYNTEKYLNRCIDSILNQNYDNFEIIIVDDGSTDNSSLICDEYANLDKRVKVIHKDNGGLSSARNVGISESKGDLIAFVDSDDWIVNNIYKLSIDKLEKFNADIVDFGIELTNEEDKIHSLNVDDQYEVYEKDDIIYNYLYEAQSGKAPFSVCRKIYKRELFDNVQFPVGLINEDIITNFKLLENAQKLVKIHTVGYIYCQDGVSITRDVLKKKDYDLIRVSKSLVEMSNKYDMEIQKLARIKLARSYFSLLAKIAYYGIDETELNKKRSINELTHNIRENYFLLMSSEIPLNRKLMITAVAINYNLLAIPLKIYNSIVIK